jgi:RNA polymerase sigma-70 factor (ECF subfamily)
VVTPLDADPEAAAEQADSVTLALLVVLEELNPRERMAFVLHDLFGVPFDEIAPIVERSPATATQLASRARRRVRTASPAVADLATQRRVLDAFTNASRRGDFDALVAVLDPDVTLRADLGPDQASLLVRGADAVASRARLFAKSGAEPTYVLVNGAIGVLSRRDGEPVAIFAPVIREGRIVAINILADPDRLAQLDLPDAG